MRICVFLLQMSKRRMSAQSIKFNCFGLKGFHCIMKLLFLGGFACIIVSLGVAEVCTPPIRVTAFSALLPATERHVSKLKESISEVEHRRLQASNYTSRPWDGVYKRRSFYVSGRRTPCSSPMCRRCTDGTVHLQCIDGVGRQHPLQECRHVQRPRLVDSLIRASQNETTEVYTHPHAVSCCATLYAWIVVFVF